MMNISRPNQERTSQLLEMIAHLTGEDVQTLDKPKEAAPSKITDDKLQKAIAETHDELIALAFIANLDGKRHPLEEREIARYVYRRLPLVRFDYHAFVDYLKTLSPQSDDFYAALNNIFGKDGWVVKVFLEQMIHLITADGKIDDRERVFLAEFLTLLKQEGFVVTF